MCHIYNRNREAFLRQLEERCPDREQQQQQAPPSTRDVPQQKAFSSKMTMTTAQDKQSLPSFNEPQNIPTDTGARPRQTANPRPADLDNTLPPPPQASLSQGDTSFSTSQQNSEVDILCSMFPDWDRNNLMEILLQLGTAEAVIDMLTSWSWLSSENVCSQPPHFCICLHLLPGRHCFLLILYCDKCMCYSYTFLYHCTV